MAETIKKYVDLAALEHLVEKLDVREDEKDQAILAASKVFAEGLSDNYDPAGKAAELVKALQDGQVKLNADAITKLNGGTDVEGSVAKQIDDMAKTLRGEITASEYDDTDVKARITATEKSIETLNGTGAGSVKKQIDDAFNEFSTKVSDDDVVNTYKELIDYAAEHKGEAATFAGDIKKNAEAIKTLEGFVGKLPEGTDAKTVIDYINAKVEAIDFSEAIATAKKEATEAAALDATSKANKAKEDAQAYADGLAVNYATAAQGTKADSAVQKGDVETGETNGTIKVQDKEVAVKGLGSAAYTPSTAYEKAGAVAALEAGQVATNKADIATNKSEIAKSNARIQSIEDELANADTFEAISTDDIDAIFNKGKTE